MKVGIISFAHMHAQSYAFHLIKHPEAELIAIWDDDQDRGNEMAEKFHCSFYSTLESFLKLDLQAVIICSENSNHKNHVIAAAKAKKHILCEKPIATSVEDALEMIQTCQKEGVILQIAYPVRFAPSIRKVKDLIDSGAIGDVIAINGTNHGQMPGGWFIDERLSGGGAATDHIVHVMDLIRWMLQDEVKTVYAELDTRFYDIAVEDCGIVLLELESGVKATIDPSWSRPKTFPTWGDVTMTIIGTKGTLTVDAFKQHTVYYNDKDMKISHLPWANDMDEELINDFLECVKEKRPPFITGVDGLRTLEVVKAAYQSNELKKPVMINRVEID